MHPNFSFYPEVLKLRAELAARYPALKANRRHILTHGDTAFWSFYHAHKLALKAARIVVYKDGSDWILEAVPLNGGAA